MRKALLAVAAALATHPSSAEPAIEDACLRAAELYFQVDQLTASKVQSSPELQPPRVRLYVSGDGLPHMGEDHVAALLKGKPTNPSREVTVGPVTCEFENRNRPFGLKNFGCASVACIPSEAETEELRILLSRDGY